MKVNLAYGQGHLTVNLPEERTTVIEPSHNPGLPDEKAAILAALQNPIGSRSLRELIKPADRVCIAHRDSRRDEVCLS
jgi:nickel-dependent lactate racemase